MSIKLPKFPEEFNFTYVDYEDSFWDKQEFDKYNDTLIKTTLTLKRINKEITKFERLLAQAKLDYDAKYRESYVNYLDSTKNETHRKILCELDAEKEYARVVYLQQIIEDLVRESYSIRTELDTLKTLGFNYRQEMKII